MNSMTDPGPGSKARFAAVEIYSSQFPSFKFLFTKKKHDELPKSCVCEGVSPMRFSFLDIFPEFSLRTSFCFLREFWSLRNSILVPQVISLRIHLKSWPKLAPNCFFDTKFEALWGTRWLHRAIVAWFRYLGNFCSDFRWHIMGIIEVFGILMAYDGLWGALETVVNMITVDYSGWSVKTVSWTAFKVGARASHDKWVWKAPCVQWSWPRCNNGQFKSTHDKGRKVLESGAVFASFPFCTKRKLFCRWFLQNPDSL